MTPQTTRARRNILAAADLLTPLLAATPRTDAAYLPLHDAMNKLAAALMAIDLEVVGPALVEAVAS